MKVLIVGGGGREHALAWKVARDAPDALLLAAPGNPGIADIAQCVSLPADDIDGLLDLAERARPDLTIVGPEASLAAGIVDRFEAAGLSIFGPSRAASRIETSKAFAKQLMVKAGVPTARAEVHTGVDAAKRAVRSFGTPVVIKASGLAAGKGVIVCENEKDADASIVAMLEDARFGAAGAEILVEEFMQGEETSVLALTDGHSVLPLLPAQDHKRLLDGDTGPNTGGMGVYAPVSIVDAGMMDLIIDRIFLPTLAALRAADADFRGLLYAGLMLTDTGPRVVEFNCRFGDPETQALLPLLESSLLDPCLAIARGKRLDPDELPVWRPGYAVTTVVAAHGYPDVPRTGDVITIDPLPPNTVVFHAGTKRSSSGSLVTAGGRVAAVTAVAPDFEAAQRASQRGAACIQFDGRHYRSDIGWREQHRHARTT